MTTTLETKATAVQRVRVYIKATPEVIWNALTNPEVNGTYGYHAVCEYDLHPGGACRVHADEAMQQHGAPEVIIDGEVVTVDAPHRLVQTWRALFSPEIAAEGPTRLTWDIEADNGDVTKVTVTHQLDGAPLTAEQVAGDIPGNGGGWSYILSDLKTLLETGSAL